MIHALHTAENVANFRSGEDDGQFKLGVGSDQLQFVRPRALEGFLPKDLEGADELGGGLTGDLLDGLEMDAVLANLLDGHQLRGSVVVLAELAHAGVIGLFGAWADGQQRQVIGEGF